MISTQHENKKFTPQQQQAIDFSEASILLEAGAGSGKTAVMTEKLFRLIKSNSFELNQLLAITFTEAAATEMEKRLYQQICAEYSVTESVKWQKLKQNFYSEKQISTIHGLCLKIISQFPYLIPMDPQFKIMSEGQANELLKEKWEDFIFEKIKTSDPILDEILGEFSLKEFSQFILVIMNQRRSNLPILSDTEIANEVKNFEHTILVNIKKLVSTWTHCQNQFKTLYDSSKKGSAYLKIWHHHLVQEGDWSRSPAHFLLKNTTNEAHELWEKCHQLLNNKPVATKRLSKDDHPQLIEALEELLSTLKNVGSSTQNPLFFSQLLLLQKKISLFFNQFLEQFQNIKKRQGLLDFNDLELYAIYLLKNFPQVRKNFQSKFAYVMIDEFQDVNLAQFKIFRYLCQPHRRNFFCVGDPKQSIYGFRGSEVRLFTKLKKSNTHHPNNQNLLLSTNFRSDSQVMQFINVVSADFFPHDNAKTPFDAPYQSLEAGKPNTYSQIPAVQIHSYGFYQNNSEKLKIFEEQLAEADLMLQLIKPRLNLSVSIAILYRSLNSSKRLQEALIKNGISFELSEGQGFYELTEISEFLNIFQLIQNPFRDVLWSNFFRSFIFEIANTDFSAIFQYKKKNDLNFPTLYNLIKNFFLTKDPLPIELTQLLNPLTSLQKKQLFSLITIIENKGSLGISQMYQDLLSGLQVKEKIERLDSYVQRISNLNNFFQLICQFEETNSPDIADFLQHVNYQIETNTSPGHLLQKDTDQKSQIKIMTVHASKGLEFDCVILPELHKKSRYRTPLLFCNTPEGLLFRKKNEFDPEEKISSPWFEQANKMQIIQETAEAKRILYVALTRAKSELILINRGDATPPTEQQFTFWNFMPSLIKKVDLDLDNFMAQLSHENQTCFFSLNFWNILLEKTKMESIVSVEYLKGHSQESTLSNLVNTIPVENFSIEPKEGPTSYGVILSPPPSEGKQQLVLSVSDIMTAEFCHFKFLEMDLRKPIPLFEKTRTVGYSPAQFGTFFHSFLEHWDGQEKDDEATYLKICTRLNLNPEHPQLISDFNHHLQNLLNLKQFETIFPKKNQAHNPEIYKELPFILKSDRWHIQGIMDRFHKSSNDLHIIDWKTGKDSSKHAQYLLQIRLYSLAAHYLFPQIPTAQIKFSLVFTGGKEAQMITYTGEQLSLNTLTHELDDLMEKIKNPHQHQVLPTTCQRCEHKKYCTYQTQAAFKTVNA